MPPVTFQLKCKDAPSAARRGILRTLRGDIDTPAFMPVGTLGTVKGLLVDRIQATGAQIVLCNTYHLALRPGDEVVKSLGGLHEMMGWSAPILTDSGGFQLFSLADRAKVTEQGVAFRSHIDGSLLELSPERAIEIQENLGSDIAMVLDHVVGLPATPEVIRDAADRSIRWAARSQASAKCSSQAQFAIVQGGLDPEIRKDCAEKLVALDFPGYAIGGLSVGEPPVEMYKVLDHTVDVLPANKPRYLMGVGRPIDLLEAIRRGIDMFDCVMPTRNGRNSLAFTDEGKLRLRNSKYREDRRPLETDCPCPACQHSRGYLRHLFIAGEMLGPILLSIHNLTYYQRLLSRARESIETDQFVTFFERMVEGWSRSKSSES